MRSIQKFRREMTFRMRSHAADGSRLLDAP
jgi:hypothetical protein